MALGSLAAAHDGIRADAASELHLAAIALNEAVLASYGWGDLSAAGLLAAEIGEPMADEVLDRLVTENIRRSAGAS
jgi:hypothetical protein